MPASVCIYVDNLMPRPPSGSLTDTFQMECTFDSFKKKGIKFLFHFPRGEACFKKNFARKTREGDRGRSQSRKRDGVPMARRGFNFGAQTTGRQNKTTGPLKSVPIKAHWH